MCRKGQQLLLLSLGTRWWEESIWDPTELGSTFHISSNFWPSDPGAGYLTFLGLIVFI